MKKQRTYSCELTCQRFHTHKNARPDKDTIRIPLSKFYTKYEKKKMEVNASPIYRFNLRQLIRNANETVGGYTRIRMCQFKLTK